MKNKTLLLLAIICITSWQMLAQGELIDAQFVHHDSTRTYKLYVPADYDGSEAWPLVIVLHGNSLTSDFMAAFTGMNAVADAEQFLVAYPQGLLVTNPDPTQAPLILGWNLGLPGMSENDDVSFVSHMIDQISLSHQVDLAKIYACGLSSGGIFSNKLACELSHRLAAVANVAGSLVEIVPCDPGRPVPVMIHHGTDDPIVPFGGVPGVLKSVTATVDFWVTNNNCDADPEETPLPNVDLEDGTNITVKRYGNCEANSEVLFYEVQNGGHIWPGLLFQVPPAFGLLNNDINLSSEIWDFFKNHQHPNPATTARIQFIHAADHETVEVVANGENLVDIFAYRTATPYMDVPGGVPLNFEIAPVDPWTFASTVNATLQLTPGETYVAVLQGTFDENDAYPVEFSLFEGAREKAADENSIDMLFYVGVPDLPTIDIIQQGGPVLADNVAFGAFGNDFVSIPASSILISPTPYNDNTTYWATYGLNMGFWKGRTAVGFSSGLASNGTSQPWVALDNGGTFPLYPVPEVSLQLAPNTQSIPGEIKIVPNPASNDIELQLNVLEEGRKSIEVFDVSGVQKQWIDLGILAKGSHLVEMNVGDLIPGYYFVKFRSASNVTIEPLLITRK